VADIATKHRTMVLFLACTGLRWGEPTTRRAPVKMKSNARSCECENPRIPCKNWDRGGFSMAVPVGFEPISLLWSYLAEFSSPLINEEIRCICSHLETGPHRLSVTARLLLEPVAPSRVERVSDCVEVIFEQVRVPVECHCG
jgi:hypothetical protein